MPTQYFYGFEPGEAEHRLKKVVKSADGAAPAIHKLIDAVALPGLTGLYDSQGRRIDEAAATTISPDGPPHRRKKLYSGTPEVVSLPNNFTVIRGTVLFGGHLTNHYGHFVIDSMSRLWARHLYPTLPILFTKPPSWSHYPTYGSDVFTALGLSPRIALVREPTIFREIICPGTSFEYRWKAFSVADEPHTAVTAALDGIARGTWRQPVYLTRSGLSNRVRKSEAEPELEEELSRRGFNVTRAETLPLSEQISLFEQAPLVIGTLGSALHTALFSRSSGTRLAILNWGRGFENCLLIDAVKQHTSYYIKSMQRRGEAGEHVLDVGRTLQLLEQAGLIAAQTRLGFAG